ncbi:MAG: hypothetical protein R2697_08045 [Ilumatobacteraceae bacterium]
MTGDDVTTVLSAPPTTQMTVLFNVTDAIGTAPNHGITRTERRLATALAGRTDVEFVLVRDHDLWQIDATEILPLLDRPDVASTPHVERFGVDDPPRAPSAVAAAVDRVRRRAPTASSDPSFSARSYRSRADDVLVSVGLDWVHGTLDIAERHVFGSGGRFVGLSYDLIPIDHPEWLFPPTSTAFERTSAGCSGWRIR